jgi:bacterioferritin
MMNQAISMEMQVSIQYMWQHVTWAGPVEYAVQEEFKNFAIAEMKHAELIAERLFFLGERPTVVPAPITVGMTLKEKIELDIQAETTTIELYKKIKEKAASEEDVTTMHIFTKILQDEEEHLDFFTSLVQEF